ncbi:sperm acrosome membrane-associated protein 4 [Astyanax mexicanus]|uniref:Sperm acrosome membrane-associated protein 4-like n=1 Tax=Astyanax mexicanus TaxID=7994 RepID=A0A8T2MHQ2_ASTMX|nr:sperm acrosome membrane-associated protein 4 [Astyanax mexicanus]KAG9281332.1 sperm acrosome membrane-associated protein 4-like [Astyanax mexicanus]
MRRAIIGVVAVIGLFALAESLTCNTCSVGLVGICLNPSSSVCSSNSSSCFTGRAKFPAISGFSGFNSQGCLDSTQCNATINGTILGATYTISQTCCNTDKCNPVLLSGAPYMQLSLPVALSTALLALVWSNSIY